jgi:hypothetical protein
MNIDGVNKPPRFFFGRVAHRSFHIWPSDRDFRRPFCIRTAIAEIPPNLLSEAAFQAEAVP